MAYGLSFKEFKWLYILLVIMIMALKMNAQPFECDSKLYQVTDGKNLKVLDAATGTYQLIGSSSINYNGAGFNSEDNYIYGIGSGNVLVRIDNTGEATDLGALSNLRALSYSGDLDTLGNWFSFNNPGGDWILSRIDVSELPPVVEEFSVTELSGVGSASKTNDVAFNPLTKKYYGMTGGKIMEYDPYNFTVKNIANYSSVADGGGYGATWSDNQGNTYFFNNGTGNIYRAVFDVDGNVTSFAFISTSEPNGNNDGMGCSLAAPPSFPEICDNGIDDDLDGLVDCEDPDCHGKETCGVSAELISSEFACQESIATYHAFFTNNSNLSNTISISETLPAGFVYLQDTLEFDQGGYSDFSIQPTEGATGAIQWGNITLESGETLRLSYDVYFDENIISGIGTNSISINTSTVGSAMFPSTISSSMNVDVCPEPVEYSCEPAFYQVYKKKGKNQPNVYGKLDPITGDYDQIAIASDYANGLGFDVNTGLVYGASGKRFIQLDADGLVIDKGIRFNKKVYRGDINESSEWFGVDGNDIVKIDVNGPPTIVATYSGQGLSGWDIAYNKDGNFYALHGATLQRFNTTTNQKETVGQITGSNIPTSGGYGAQWTGSDGYLYASHNSSGSILRINVETLEARIVSSSVDGLSKNDGFSCPISIPAVFEFDYGDNSALPQSRILSYSQDLQSDDLPDYSTVWIGNTVSYDTADPANASANGDNDDGFDISTEIQNGKVSYALGLNANQECEAYYLIGLDWDNDGVFDKVVSGSTSVTGPQTELGELNAPDGYTEGILNARVIASESTLDSANISGDLMQMGEVEDYKYEMTTACETCEVSSANLGGLESNGNLAGAIAKRNFKRSVTKEHKELKANQLKLSSFLAARTTGSSEFYFPQTGIKGTEEVTISTPEDLVEITNATNVLSADYYEGDRRIAAALLFETEGEVYNHAKNICDRLNDKSIEDTHVTNLDGYRLVTAKIKDAEGVVEYSAWFGLRKEVDYYVLESLWNVDKYPVGDYLNFQVWGASVSQVYHIAREIIRNVGNVRFNTSLQQLPDVFVKRGKYEQGKLYLTVENRSASSSITVDYNKRITESSTQENESTIVALSGEKEEEVVVETGFLFDAGISIKTSSTDAYDALYLADGAWGTDFNPAYSEVSKFEILPVSEEIHEGFLIERGFELQASSSDVVNVFRNVRGGERTLDVSDFSSISFWLDANVPLEVVLVEKSLESWEDRIRTTVQTTSGYEKQILKLENFEGYDPNKSHDLQSIVFSYLNQSGADEEVMVTLNNMVFGNEKVILGAESLEDKMDYTVFPNPASDLLYAHINSETHQSFRLLLLDLGGKVIEKLDGNLQVGTNELELKLRTSQRGMHFLRLELEDGSAETRKVLINK